MINTPKRGKTGGSARRRTSARNTGGGVLAEVSERKHLTSREVERLIEATKGRRNEVRDRCLLLLMFRHGLRVSEAKSPACWHGWMKPRDPEQLDLPGFRLHPLKGDLAGYWSITVRANWRIIFRFEQGDATDVDLVDYH